MNEDGSPSTNRDGSRVTRPRTRRDRSSCRVAHARGRAGTGRQRRAPSGLDALSAVINANIRLPQREPGTAAQPVAADAGPVAPRTDPRCRRRRRSRAGAARARARGAARCAVEVPDVAEVEVIGSDPEAELEPAEALAPDVEVPQTLADETCEAVATCSRPNGRHDRRAAAQLTRAGRCRAGVRPQRARRRRRDPALPDAAVELVHQRRRRARLGLGRGRRRLAGCRPRDRRRPVAAHAVRAPGPRPRQPAGAGRRRPSPPRSLRRDPEAIRARLAAHAAGVARGRTVAGDAQRPSRPAHRRPTRT